MICLDVEEGFKTGLVSYCPHDFGSSQYLALISPVLPDFAFPANLNAVRFIEHSFVLLRWRVIKDILNML